MLCYNSRGKPVYGGSKMDKQNFMVKELFDTKSLNALKFLIICGRELEFKVNGKECFISRHESKQNVSLWIAKDEQSFDSVPELIEKASIGDMDFLTAWEQAELAYLF